MSYSRTEFRLKTAIATVGVLEPTVITPTIREPVKWSEIDLIGEVDEKYHGFNYNYSDGNLTLDFRCESARSLITEQYYTYGTDAVIGFQVWEIDRQGVEYLEYDGLLDFNNDNCQILPGKVSCSVVLNSIHIKVKSRFESEISIDRRTSLDNVDIIPPIVIEIPVQGQTVEEKGQIQKQVRQVEVVDYPSPGAGGIYIVMPNMLPAKETNATPAATQNAIPDLATLGGVNYLYGGVTSGIDPFTNPLLTAQQPGHYHIELDWNFHIDARLTKGVHIGKAKFTALVFDTYLFIRQPAKADTIVLLEPRKDGSGFVDSVDYPFDIAYTLDIDLPVGAQVFVFQRIFVGLTQSEKLLSFVYTTTNIRVLIERKTTALASRTQAYNFIDALRHVYGCISSDILPELPGTGKMVGSLIDFASVGQAFDGYATEYAVTTGGALRGLPKPPTFTMKELMEVLSAHHVAGILYERDPVTGVETIRIEPGEFFYQDNEIMEIRELYEYSETPDLDLLANRIRVGYSDYPDEGLGVNYEFNTERTYQTPIVSLDKEIEILCPLIAAGTAIEEARRLGIKTVDSLGVEVPTTQDAGPYDEKKFLLHVSPQTQTDTVRFYHAEPTFQRPYFNDRIELGTGNINRLPGGTSLKPGDIIVFNGTGTANDGVEFLIDAIVIDKTLLNPTYEIDFFTPLRAYGGPYAVTWALKNQPVKLRTNERLLVDGVVDATNTLNMELEPARMFHKNAAFINSGMFYKDPAKEYKCIAYKNNGNFSTRVKTTSPALPGDPDKQTIYSTKDVAIGAMQQAEKIFQPELVTIKCPMTKEEQRVLYGALQNRGDINKRMGYVTVYNPDGNPVQCFVRKISYNRVQQVATITFRKKSPPADLKRCQDYYDYLIGQFPGNPAVIKSKYLFCRFNEFQPV